MEGHTPIGFEGQGGGIFAGDNINSTFPNTVDDGVQIWLSLDLKRSEEGTEFWQAEVRWDVESAVLSTENVDINGTPFTDLGDLRVTQVHFDAFSSALWDLQPDAGAVTQVFSTSADGPFEADITSVVQHAVDDRERYAQLNIRFDQAGDADGDADMALFNLGDTNATEEGIFTLLVRATPR